MVRGNYLAALVGLAWIPVACVGDDPVSSQSRDAGGGTEAGATNIVYVDSAGGDDSKDGLSIASRVKSIGAAIAVAKSRALPNPEVRVCRGTYRETNLVISQSLALRGAYNCNTWDRIPGYPTALAPDENETRIVNELKGDPTASRTTVAIRSNQVTVEGFTIEGTSEAGTTPSNALEVREGANVRIVSNRIVAGSAKVSAGVGASGINVLGAVVRVEKNQILGGASESDSSVGLALVQLYDAGGSSVVQNTLEAGTAKGLNGAILVNVDGSMPANTVSTIEGNSLRGGSPSARASGGVSLFGVVAINGQKVDITNNRIGGIAVGCESKEGCVVHAIFVDSAQANVQRNFIEGGTMNGPANAINFFRGIQFAGSGLMVAENNVIMENSLLSSDDADTIGIGVFGRDCPIVDNKCAGPPTKNPSAKLRHNTIHLANRSSVVGANRQRGLLSTAKDMVFEDNLLVGGNVDRGVEWYPCLGASFASMQNNAVVADSAIDEFMSVRSAVDTKFDCALQQSEGVDLAQTRIAMGTGNISLKSPTGVIREPNPTKWTGKLESGVLDLASGAPCSIARARPTTPPTLRDIVDGMRDTQTPSIGAYEFPKSGTCK